MNKIIIGTVSARQGDADGCYCDHERGYFGIERGDYTNELVRPEGIKYLAFDKKPEKLSDFKDGEYNEFSPYYEELKNFIAEDKILSLHGTMEEEYYSGRCYSEWTCGEGDVTLDYVRCNEINNLNRKYILLIL